MLALLPLWLAALAAPPADGPILKLNGVRTFLQDTRWWERQTLRRLLDGEVTLLGYDRGPGYAFLAADATKAHAGATRGVRRFLIATGRLLVSFDLIAEAEGAVEPRRATDGEAGVSRVDVLSKQQGGDALLLTVFGAGDFPAPQLVSSIDLAGVRVRDQVFLFYTEPTLARSALSVYFPGDEPLRFIVTGLAPGTWEIWRNGWLEDPMALVSPGSGVLYFEGLAGSYFLRRLS